MAEGSNAGWHNLAKELRICGVCGGKLTLKERGGLWFDDYNHQVFHHPCKVKAMREARELSLRGTS